MKGRSIRLSSFSLHCRLAIGPNDDVVGRPAVASQPVAAADLVSAQRPGTDFDNPASALTLGGTCNRQISISISKDRTDVEKPQARRSVGSGWIGLNRSVGGSVGRSARRTICVRFSAAGRRFASLGRPETEKTFFLSFLCSLERYAATVRLSNIFDLSPRRPFVAFHCVTRSAFCIFRFASFFALAN